MNLDAPLTPAQAQDAALHTKREGYALRVLVAWDELGAAILDIQNDQTISSQAEIDAHRHGARAAFAKILNEGLDLISRSHGQKAQIGDIVRDEADIATNTAALKAEGVAIPPAALPHVSP